MDAVERGNGDQDVGSKAQRNGTAPETASQFLSTTLTVSNPTPATGRNGNYRQKASPAMSTIDSSSADGYGADSLPLQLPPTHSMFNSLYDDSDGSDGSIVFNNSNQKKQVTSRERFPSFDSMGSSGSVVRHAPQHRNQTSPQSLKVTQQNLEQVNPQMLPYDQRRKLMKLKKQQQQQQQQIQRDPSQPQLCRTDGRYAGGMQYMMSPLEVNHHQQQPPNHHFNGIPISTPPHSPQHFVCHIQPHLPLAAYPNHPNYVSKAARLGPYRAQPPRLDSNRPPPGLKPSARRQSPPQPQTPPLHSLPRGPPRLGSQHQNSGARRPLTNSLDSSDQELARMRNPATTQSNQSGPSNGNAPPPPPPPPPLAPPIHVRAESNGSVSSLGSQGSVFGFFLGAKSPNSNDDNRKATFLNMLNPFSPKTRERRQFSPHEFHLKNQDFLKKSKAGPRHLQQPTPPPHRRLGSMDRPPASRGTHKRLPSIENDDWGEPHPDLMGLERSSSDHSSAGNVSASSQISSSEDTQQGNAPKKVANYESVNERSYLLPPSGQGSQEIADRRLYRPIDGQASSGRRRSKNRSSSRRSPKQRESEIAGQRNNRVPGHDRNLKRKSRRRLRMKRRVAGDESNSSGDSNESSSSSSYGYRQWTRRRAQMLEDERNRLIAQWKAEARAEALALQRRREDEQWHRRLGRYIDSEFGDVIGRAYKCLTFLEVFVCNLPLTVGAIAMAIVTLGVVWFKFMEENLDSCEPVQFHSSQCTFPEFPGCFFCDVTDPLYQLGVNFHFACSTIAGVLALSIVLKMVLATQVVLDEMSSPTTASPAGLICMTTVCVFAGRGFIGQVLVSIAACIHLVLVIWFIYMALAYHIMPDPSWYPNTVGIGMSAVKTWLYYPMSGHFLMAISLSLNFFFFPISLVRVALNEKISATVGYMQMSAPAISLYALTIMAQPSFEQEKPDINRFQRAHRLVYLPAMHFLFVLSCIGFLASIHALWFRWKPFEKRGFSPAHAAFCFPTLSHANAIQAYRAAINSFSNEPPGTPLKVVLYVYWVVVLLVGTIATCWVTTKFFYNLPRWTNIEVEDEDEPPAPYETAMTLQNVIATGDALVQPFVSPAVLQANETGALVLVRRKQDDSCQRFVRTRKLAALGFEPIMNWSEMEGERELLLEWVGKHAPHQRNRKLSVPGIDFNYGSEGVAATYGTEGGTGRQRGPSAKAPTNPPTCW